VTDTDTRAGETGTEAAVGDAEAEGAAEAARAEPEIVPETVPEAASAARRRAAARKPKLDALLAAAVDVARNGVLELAPAAQVGEYAGAVADGDRLVTHRFEARVPGYVGWQWFATLSRVPRGKNATVCEIGLLPSERSLLAPEWVPWAERIRPEDVAAPEADQEPAVDSVQTGDEAAEAEEAAAGSGVEIVEAEEAAEAEPVNEPEVDPES
jgi:Protein of unknown function (DUF3027)